MIKSDTKTLTYKSGEITNNSFELAKLKLFKLIDEGVNSKTRIVADKNFWKKFKTF